MPTKEIIIFNSSGIVVGQVYDYHLLLLLLLIQLRLMPLPWLLPLPLMLHLALLLQLLQLPLLLLKTTTATGAQVRLLVLLPLFTTQETFATASSPHQKLKTFLRCECKLCFGAIVSLAWSFFV